jgi:hypothetical protein
MLSLQILEKKPLLLTKEITVYKSDVDCEFKATT